MQCSTYIVRIINFLCCVLSCTADYAFGAPGGRCASEYTNIVDIATCRSAMSALGGRDGLAYRNARFGANTTDAKRFRHHLCLATLEYTQSHSILDKSRIAL